MAYTHVTFQFGSGDEVKYLQLRTLIMDSYPTADWVVDWEGSNVEARRLAFIVNDMEGVEQGIAGFAKDFGIPVSFITRLSSRKEFDCLDAT